MRYVSIAKDFYYETSASTLSYYITCNGRTVYSDVSVKPSDSPVNRICIRNRIADYLEIDMPDFRDYDGVVIPHPEQLRDFELYSSDGTLLETYRALLGYYDEWDGNVDEVLSDPVNGHTDPRQKIFWGAATNLTGDTGDTGTTEIEVDIDKNYPETDYLTLEILTDGTLCWGPGPVYSPVQRFNLMYSRDGGETWGTLDPNSGGTTIDVSAGEMIYLTGNLYYIYDQGGSEPRFPSFYKSTAMFNAFGKAESVMSKSTNMDPAMCDFFSGSKIVDASGIVFPDKRNPMYKMMFSGCTYLKYAPEVLPSKRVTYVGGNSDFAVIGGYENMFADCTSLKRAPEILADVVDRWSCIRMFAGCTSLEKGPSILPALSAPYACYKSMFEGCTSLKETPILPATILSGEAYAYMFAGCSSMKKATCYAVSQPDALSPASWKFSEGWPNRGTFYTKRNATYTKNYLIPYDPPEILWTTVFVD